MSKLRLAILAVGCDERFEVQEARIPLIAPFENALDASCAKFRCQLCEPIAYFRQLALFEILPAVIAHEREQRPRQLDKNVQLRIRLRLWRRRTHRDDHVTGLTRRRGGHCHGRQVPSASREELSFVLGTVPTRVRTSERPSVAETRRSTRLGAAAPSSARQTPAHKRPSISNVVMFCSSTGSIGYLMMKSFKGMA